MTSHRRRYHVIFAPYARLVVSVLVKISFLVVKNKVKIGRFVNLNIYAEACLLFYFSQILAPKLLPGLQEFRPEEYH